ncbi:hypothetical protein [Anaerotignum propionicum]|uniref:hypothetical protein n=1 Tax=Anaerotignum propionicum TaxID=28446 RepID=UPI0012FF1C7D|nr:hypothetical protein [Anaerotignum propionicum]
MARLRGTTYSPLPSSGITHLHWYYQAIRLPVMLLQPSLSAYHSYTHSVDTAGSPQLM